MSNHKYLFIVLVVFFYASCALKRTGKESLKHNNGVDNNQTLTLNEDEEEFDEKEKNKPLYPYRPSSSKIFSIIHTKLELIPVWSKSELEGTAFIDLVPFNKNQETLVLDAKGMLIHKVLINNTGKITPALFTYNQKQLNITLDKKYSIKDTLHIKIQYTSKPNEITKEISSDKGLYFIDPLDTIPDKPTQLWTQGEPENNSCWFPTIDAPNQKMTQEIYLTVEKKYTTLSNGLLIYSKDNPDGTRTDYWKQGKKHSPYLAMIAAGVFTVVKDTWRDSIEVSYYVEPEYQRYAKIIFGKTPKMISFYSKLLNYDYAWDKYSEIVVRDYMSGAMENTGAVIFNSSFQHNFREHLDRNGETTICHELFHHWFGDLVTCESWANLSLNESFADYSEYLWEEYEYGRFSADFGQQKALQTYLHEAETKKHPIIHFYNKDPDAMFDVHTYEKGGRVLHMLRKYLGDDIFFESLSLYLHTFQFSNAEIHDLRLIFEKVSGEDLNWFFNQWFLKPGHPILNVTHRYLNGILEVNVIQKQDTLSEPVYQIPLKIALWFNDVKKLYDIEINKTHQKFSFPVPSEPTAILFDAEQQLLGEIDHHKSLPELIQQFYQANLYAPLNESLELTADSIRHEPVFQMNNNALDHPFWKIRQQAVDNFTSYTGNHLDELTLKLKKLAIADTFSRVRSSAINTLCSIAQNSEFDNIFLDGLKDSAYSVVTSSLRCLLDKDRKELVNSVQPYMNSDNPNLVIMLAKIFVKFKDTTKYGWYINKFDHQNRGDYFQLLQQFTDYIILLNPDEQIKAIAFLSGIIASKNFWWIRLEAYNGLDKLYNNPMAQQTKTDLQAKEEDEQIKAFLKIKNGK